jgi:RHS repeat-associated protein
LSELIVDGRRAQRRVSPQSSALGPEENHGVFEYGQEIKEGETTVLPFTIWLPKIDTAHAVSIPRPMTSEVVVTSPKLQGLEVRLAPNTTITDHEGKPVTEVSLTQIPLDRTPFPLPRNVRVPIYFTAQPGGAYIHNPNGIGARIHYPNSFNELPGTKFEFWHYDPGYEGWYKYGLGTVPPDGKQVIPDPGISVHEFTGAMVGGPGLAAAIGTAICSVVPFLCSGGDPVNLATGLFVLNKTDLYLPDGVMPLSLTRTYRQSDTYSRAFGIGASQSYDLFLVGDISPYTYQELILPDGGRLRYNRTSAGTNWADAVYEHVSTQTRFYKSVISWNGNGWDLKLRDGTVYVFDEGFGASRPGQTGLLSIRDRNGNTTTITRDSAGNATQITAPGGRWIALTYDSSNRVTQAQDTIGRIVTYQYDTTGRLIKVTDPNGGITEYTYDTSSRMLTIKDARGIVFITNEYDATGKVIKQTMIDGGIYLFAYTMNGSTVTQTDVTDPRGNIRRVAFNSEGQILSHTHAVGTADEQVTTHNIQSGTNFVLSEVDPLNRTTAYTHDSMGNTTSVTRLAGTGDAVTTAFTYEPVFNQVSSITDPLNHTTTFGHDAEGNVISVTNSLNQTTTIGRNSAGQPISIIDPLNNTTQFVYDFGDPASATDPLGNTSTRFTDAAGRVLTTFAPLGNLTLYDYDALNRLTKVTDPLSGATNFGYDPNGNLLSVTDARSNQTVYTYENMDRLATRKDPLLRTESYQYDLAGNLTQFTDRKSQAASYTYDGLDRRTGVTYADTSTTSYTYDKGNRLLQVNDSVAGTITRTFDGLNRLTSEQTPQGSVSYTYDAAGRRTTMTVAGQSTVNYSYDNANRLTQITQGSTIVTYTYDAAGRRTSLTLPNGVLVEYSYDSASRLTSITYKQNGTLLLGDLTYEYDKNGNRIKTGGSFARTGVPQALGTTAYNAANHQTTFGDKTLTYDNNGNLQTITDSGGTTTYTWNARNQLTGISGPGVSATFVYDGLGRREKKTINGGLAEFLFDGVDPVQETSAATILGNMLSGAGVDEFITRSDVGTGTTSTLLTDALGSPVALADGSGVVQTEYTYEPFGKTTLSGSSNSSSYQYTGRENDGTGLYYYRARYYHPALQRFISEDPIEFAAGDPNLYAYTFNSPTNFVDPSGNFVPTAAVGVALCGVGAAAGAYAAYAFAGDKPSLGAVAAGVAGGCAAGIGLGWGIGIGLEATFPGLMLAGGHGFFWDGIAGGLGATLANVQAGAIGAATIGQTFTGSALALAEKVGISYQSLQPYWVALSRGFASGAGSATVAVGNGASTASVYGSTELPAFSRAVSTAYWYVR